MNAVGTRAVADPAGTDAWTRSLFRCRRPGKPPMLNRALANAGSGGSGPSLGSGSGSVGRGPCPAAAGQALARSFLLNPERTRNTVRYPRRAASLHSCVCLSVSGLPLARASDGCTVPTSGGVILEGPSPNPQLLDCRRGVVVVSRQDQMAASPFEPHPAQAALFSNASIELSARDAHLN